MNSDILRVMSMRFKINWLLQLILKKKCKLNSLHSLNRKMGKYYIIIL